MQPTVKEDAGATYAETSLTIDPLHAEARATELNTAPEGSTVITSTPLKKSGSEQCIAVGGDNGASVVSASNSASSSGHNNRRSAGGFIRHAPTIIEPDEYGRPADKGSEV